MRNWDFSGKLRARKAEQRQKYSYYNKIMQPARDAKRECIHFLGNLGRKYKVLALPIFILLVAFIFAYNFLYYLFINLRVREKTARALAMLMTVVLVITSVDLTAFALQSGEEKEYYSITSFGDEQFENIEVPFGTDVEHIGLPETISVNADYYELTEDANDIEDAAESTEGENLNTESGTEESTEEPVIIATEHIEYEELMSDESSEDGGNADISDQSAIDNDIHYPNIQSVVTIEETTRKNEVALSKGSVRTFTVMEVMEPEAAPEEIVETPAEEPTNIEEPEPIEEPTNIEEPETTEEPAATENPAGTEEPTEEVSPAPIENTPEVIPTGAPDETATPDGTLSPLPEGTTIPDELLTPTPGETPIPGETPTPTPTATPDAEQVKDKEAKDTDKEPVFEIKESLTLDLEVTWECEDYDPLTSGEYTFSAILPEEYNDIALRCTLETPTITVIVTEAEKITLSTVVDGVEIVLEAEPGVFVSDVSLKAERVIDEKITDLIEDKLEKENTNPDAETTLNDYMAFDIEVVDSEGNAVQPREVEGVNPEHAVTLTFKNIKEKIEESDIEEGEQNLDVYYVDDSISEIEELNKSESGEDVSINPEHFSIYVCSCSHTAYATVNTWAELCKKVLGQSGDINVKLGADIIETPLTGYSTENGLYIDGGAKVNLNMNGHYLMGREGIGQVILVANGGQLEIHNTTGVDASIIAVNNDAAIKVTGSGSSLDLRGATIKNEKASGSVIAGSAGATVNLNGGELFGSGVGLSLSDSTSKLNQGSIIGGKRGIYLSNSSVTLENNSVIRDYSECGIYMNNPASGSLSVVSADIIGNSAFKTTGINCSAGASMSLGSDVNFTNNTDIKIAGYEAGSGVVGKANTLINLLNVPANVVSIAVDGMTIDSGAVQFTSNYISGAENKFKSAVSTSYDIWKPSTDNFLQVGAKDDCTITAQAQNVFQNKDTAGEDLIAGTVQIGSGEITDQSIVATAATNTSNTGKSVSTRVKFGAQVTLKTTLVNAEKYTFKGWKNSKGTIVSTASTYVFTASDNDSLTAVYEKKKGVITVDTNDSKLGSVKGGGTFEYDQIATLEATASNGKEWKQWNDGPIYDVRDKYGSLDHVVRKVKVSGDVTYTALFGEPDPDKALKGTLYANVDQLKSNSAPKDNDFVLFLPSNVEVEKVGTDIALGNLPEGAAILEILSDQEYPSATVKKGNVQNYTKNSGGYVANGNGAYVHVEVADSKFDTCKWGYIEYNASTGYWYYWCYATGVQGLHDYNVYRYKEKTDFTAGNISVTKIDSFIPNATSREEIEKSTINIRITTENGGNYELAGISFLKNAIDYNVGDKTVVFKVGEKVTYTYYFPEAMIGDVEYKTLQEAVNAANTKTASGGTAEIKVIGPAVSQIDVPDNINVNGGVTFKNYDGSTIEAGEGGVKASVDNKGVVTIINGTATATPKDNTEITVGVGEKGATVTANTEMTIIAKEDSSGNVQREVIPSSDVNEIVISPDGDPSHTVTFYNCDAGKGYGVNEGILTEEDKVVITDGTEYNLQVELNGSQTVVETESSNAGKTTITKGNSEAEGGDYLTVVSEAAHDDIIINTDGKNETTYTTNTTNTVIKVAPGKDKTPEGATINEVILDTGSVDVSKFGEVITKDGTVFKNTSETGEAITVTAEDTEKGTGEISIPSGGKAEITPEGADEPIYVSVPPAKAGDAQNSPVTVKPSPEGGVIIEAEAGNPVTIGEGDDAVTYNTGDFETVLEIRTGEGGEPEVVVTDGSVILQPGQTIIDSNGVVFTNPETPEGEDPKPLTLSITEGEPTGVKTTDGGSFVYQLPGEEPKQFENPSSGDASFNVSKDGEIKLDSKVDLKGGGDPGEEKGVSISTGEGDTEVKPDSENKGVISVDTEEKTVTVKKEGDKVNIGGEEYTVTDDNTVIKVGDNGPELISGGITLDGGGSVIVGETEVKSDEEGGLSIEKKTDGGLDIKVPEGGTFSVQTPGNESTDVIFTNPTEGEATYEVAPNGGIILPVDSETICKHGEEEISVKSQEPGTVVTPSTDGVTVTAPKDSTVEINGNTYVNESNDKQLELSVDGEDVILKRGNVSVEEGGGITLYNGDKLTVEEGAASVDEKGNIEVPKDAKITVSDKGEETVIKSTSDDTKVEIDPESGTAVLKEGSVELEKGSGLNVVYKETPVYDEGVQVDTKEEIMNIESTGDAPAKVNADGTVEVPKGGAVRIENTTETGTATNIVKVPTNSSGDVTIKTNTDGSVDANLGNGETVSVNGNEYTAKEGGTEINVGPKGATLESGSVGLDSGESINAGGSNVTNSGAKGSEVVIKTEVTPDPSDPSKTERETIIDAPKGGKFTLSEEGKDNGYTFTNPATENKEYKVNDEGNLILDEGNPIQAKVGNKDVEISGPSGDDVEIKVTKEGINLTAEPGSEISVGGNTVSNATPAGEEFKLIVDNKGDVNLASGEAELPEDGKIYVTDSTGKKALVENSGDNEESSVKVKSDGTIEFKHEAPAEGESDPSKASVSVTGADGSKNTYVAVNDEPVQIKQSETSPVPELTEGTVELKGSSDGKEKTSIVVNGLSVTNEGKGDGVVVSKSNEGGTETTSLKVEPGSEFGLSAPGEEDKAYKFSNPATSTEPSNYNVDNNGNINIEEGSSISFKDAKGNESYVSVPEAAGGNSKITVDEEGVKIIAPNNQLVEVNGVKYRGHSTDPLVLSVDEEGDTVLKEGVTGLREGEHISVETRDDEGKVTGKMKLTVPPYEGEGSAPSADYISSDGTITTQQNEPRTFILTDEEGKSNEIKTKPAGDGTPVSVAATEEGFVLKSGKVEVPAGSEVIVNGSAISNTGEEGSTIDVSKTTEGGTQFTLSEGASFAMSDPKSGEEYEFINPETGSSTFTLDDDGNITLGAGSSLSFTKGEEEPTVIENASEGTGVKVTEDGVTLSVPNGGSVTVGGVTYTNESTDKPLSIAINEDGEAVLVDGTIELTPEQSISVKNSEGEYVPVSGDGAVVTSEGQVSVPADSTVTIGDREYEVSESSGATFEVPETNEAPILTSGSVDLKEGDEIAVKNGTPGNETVQKVVNKGNTDPEAANEISISSDGTVVAEDGAILEIQSDSSDNGQGVKVQTTPGSTLNVNGGSYTSKDSTGEFVLDINGTTGEVKLDSGKSVDVTNGNITVGDTMISTTGDEPVSVTGKGTSKPEILVPAGGNVTIGSTQKEGSVEVKIPEASEEEPKDPKKVSIDSSGNISVPVEKGEKVTIGGITYTSGDDGKIVVNGQTGALDANKTDSKPAATIDPASFNQESYSYKVPAGASVDVGGVTYVAPKNGMTLIGNEDGNPIIQVQNSGSTVSVGGQKYTTGTNNTQFVVNDDGSLTLKDNGSDTANSSIAVSGNEPTVINGNKYTGSKDGNYSVTYSENGDVVTTKNGSNVSVEVGKGQSVILDGVKNAKGDNIVIKSGTDAPTTVVVDKSSMNEKGSYDVNIIAGGNTVLKPVYDEEGNLIGYETEKKAAPAPVPTPEPPHNEEYYGEAPSYEESTEVPVANVSMTPKPSPSLTPAPSASPENTARVTRMNRYTLTVEDGVALDNDIQNGGAEDGEGEDGDIGLEDADGENSLSGADVEGTAQDGADAEEAIPGVTKSELVIIDVEDDAEIPDIPVEGEVDVNLGQGSIAVEALGGRINSLKNTVNAIVNKDDYEAVKNGSKIRIRLKVSKIDNDVPENDKAVMLSALNDYSSKVEGLVLGEFINVSVLKQINDGEWEEIHDLDEEVEILLDVPENLQAEGRTFWVMRNHEGKCDMLDDLDETPETVTIKSGLFSSYALCYTDTKVDVSKVHFDNGGIGTSVAIWIGIALLVGVGIFFLLLMKRRKEESEEA